ncbi:MAG: CapA family protein [Candidatus Dependentiae bacterium]
MKLAILSNVFVGKYIESDYDFFWADIKDVLQKQDLRLLNPQQQLFHQLVDNTQNAVHVIKAGNIELINLADNMLIHDNSKVPLALNRADIHTVGIGINEHQAHEPVEFETNGIKIGIIGFSNKKEHEQHTDGPNIFYTPFGDVTPIKSLLHEIKQEVDILVALVQWGSERPEPNDTYQRFAHTLIDEGIDIIHGESDHVYLGVENYNGKLIIYDSGDFVDIYMSNEKQSIPRSFIYEIEVEKRSIHKAKLIPVLLQENQLKKATDENKTEAITLMQTISKNLGTTISDNGEIEF